MALLALPVELIDACLSPLTLNHRALAAVARTSRLLNTCATRILYRHLSLSAYAKNLPLISLLSNHPHLAAHVRTFSVYLDDADPAVVPTYSDLQRALGLMTNLMSLALYVDASASWILSPPQGENSQKSDGIPSSGPAFYPRLEHLTCNFPFDAHLASFLAQTPSLISLTLSSILSDSELESDPQDLPTPKCHIHIPTSHIPLLEGYTGPADLFPTLLSRPLRAVHLSGDLALDFLSVTGAPSAGGAVPPLRARDNVVTHQSRGGSIPAAGGAALQVMSAMTSEPPAELLDALALAFPNLVCLRVMTTHAMWDLPDLVRNRFPFQPRARSLTVM